MLKTPSAHPHKAAFRVAFPLRQSIGNRPETHHCFARKIGIKNKIIIKFSIKKA